MKRLKNRAIIITASMMLILASLLGCSGHDQNIDYESLVSTGGAVGAESEAAQPGSDAAARSGPAKITDTTTKPDTPSQTSESQPSGIKTEEAAVSRHVDGDTVYVKFSDGREEKVRFIGINCPESTSRLDPYGKESSDYTKSRLLGKTVYLQKDVSNRDQYDRLLRYVWLEPPKSVDEKEIRNKLFNAVLVLEGCAQAATFPPDVKYANYFTKFQREAREKDKGLWGSASGSSASTGQSTGASSTKSSSDTVNKSEQVYVGSSKSDKYHYPSCTYAKRIKPENLVSFKSKSDAQSEGYVPCKGCKP